MSRMCVITGATSGIGHAAASRFSLDGYDVFAIGRRREALDKLAAAWPKMMVSQADLRENGSMARLLATARMRFNKSPSIVVLSAGHGLKGSLLSSNSGKWDELIQTNLLSMMRQMRETIEFMRKEPLKGSSRDLIVIGSTVGRQVSAANPVYGATKFAIHSLCESLRQEVCSEGIRVTLIEPGFVKTGFQETAGYDPEWFAQLEAKQGPFLSPDDIAHVISFVVTRPDYVHIDDIRIRPTGQTI